jgi:hypothetical protein
LEKTLEIEISNYENPIKELIGKSISEVNYYEIDYGEPFWNKTEFHSLDYGIEITMTDKTSYYFIWGNEFSQYDVKFREGSILNEFSSQNGAKKYSINENLKWKDLIGKKINEIESYWPYWNLINNEKRNYYPQDVRIEFENGKEIWISALEIKENRTIGMQDHLTIIFDKQTAEKYKIGIKNVV